jgi:primosomal protein N' (replication factor Y)
MKTMDNIFIVNIVPLVNISISQNQVFSYFFEEKLSPGTLVEISFSGRKIKGIVLKSYLASKKNLTEGFKIKKIEKILAKDFLSAKQIELAKFIADYYFSSLGVVFKSFVPQIAKARNIKYKAFSIKHETWNIEQGNIILTKEQKNAVKRITENFKGKFLLFGPSGSGKTEVYIHSILAIRKKEKNFSGQFLILIPDAFLTPWAIKRYARYFKPEEMAVLNSHLSKGQFYANWEKIKSGQAKIIIGSRMAVFAPFQNLALIAVDEEQDMSYKQWDMNPRYDARIVASKLAEIHTVRIVFGSATPRIETYFQAQEKNLELLELPYFGQIDEKKLLAQTFLVDMKKERWEKNTSLLSKKLRSEIAWALKNKKQVFLFVSRQGLSSFSICSGCKEVLRCPKCDRAVILNNDGQYHCLHCTYKTSLTPKCVKCGNLVFNNLGMGTQKVEREILNFFPGAKILRADSQSAKKAGSLEKIYTEFCENRADILVGTQMVSKGWDLPNVILVGIMDADNLLAWPDFFSYEKAFQTMLQVAGRTNRPKSKFSGVVILQTFHPENSVFQMVAQRDYVGFFQNEIEERKKIGLPPLGKIIKLTFQDYSWEKTESEAEKTLTLLQKNKDAQIKIFDAQTPLLSKIRGRFRKQIVIRIKGKNALISDNLKKNIRSLPAGWLIDIDPISLI